ncbi:hypothetical protein [Caballeronia sp. SBC2]|uniref:hypothetical protein n=1 Tax=Caballeronia sp. SBC2 TaxID=2705547 RepID=UPI0013E20393|nr:hypothetical protein [Caballeronia sp. SBC2]QIE30200.1 hypothetical protein SBC2_82760 [Caballeronia sp. SBC2]
MFDDALEMMMLYGENFRGGVRDSLGASIVADVLDPILKEIDSLRASNEEFQRQALSVDRILEDTRAIQRKDYGCAQ